LGWAFTALFVLFALCVPVHAEVEPGTLINNVARATFSIGLANSSAQSNTVINSVTATPSTAVLNTMQYDPASAVLINVPGAEYEDGAGSYITLPPPNDINTGTPILVNAPVALTNSSAFQAGEALFLVVRDSDQDLNFSGPDSVVVTLTTTSGDTETIRLFETGAHTGVFAGYVQSGSSGPTTNNGILDVGPGAGVSVSYTDASNASDTETALVQVGARAATVGLFVTKMAGRNQVEIGDFLQYSVKVQESLGSGVMNVTVYDRLPKGFRYQSGSAVVNGTRAPDPSISRDGRTMSFRIGGIAANGSVNVRYVVEVAVGSPIGKATNSANATGTGAGPVTSNTATATVMVRDPFFRTHNIIVGQVILNQCGSDVDDEEVKTDGLKGVRIYLEDGTYVITDSNGMYHFEGVKPGAHVVQVDLDTIPERYEIVKCEEDTAFAGRTYSQFVDLKGGALWRADFHVRLKPREKGALTTELLSSLDENTVSYTIPFTIGKVSLANLRASVILPKGVEFIEGSARLDEKALPAPEEMFGSLTFRLGDIKAGFKGELKLKATVGKEYESGKLVTRAMFTFNTPKQKDQRTSFMENVFRRTATKEERIKKTFVVTTSFPLGEEVLSEDDKAEIRKLAEQIRDMEIDQLFAVGHTDSIPLKASAKFNSNYALSKARARNVVTHLGELLGLPEEKLSHMGAGPDEPVADNDTPEGRAKNRRVEVKVYTDDTIKEYSLEPAKDRSGTVRVETQGQRPFESLMEEDILYKPPEFVSRLPEYEAEWLEAAEPGIEWLWPEAGFQPFNPTTHVALKHDPGHKVKLFINGEEAPPLLYAGMDSSRSRTVGVSLWRAVPIREGSNTLAAVVSTPGGEQRIEREVYLAGPPVRAELVRERSRLVANGKAAPVIAVRLFDANGRHARPGLLGGFSAAPPYAPERAFKGSLEGRAQYVIGYEGIGYLKLQPTTKTGEARLRLVLKGGEQDIRAWLDPEPRDWILVGVAEGTAGYNTLSGNSESLREDDEHEEYYQDGKVAFFAKGKIKGSWLLTMAYDSSKPSYNEYELHQTIDPDKFYTLYGDATRQGYEASSARRIYIKLERKQFYALFGDFNTGLTLTELSRYSRSLNGLKSEYKGKIFEYNAFVSDTSQAFVRDEIRGDGTSGLYRLSRSNIVMNSEKVRIEVRDRFRTEIVLSTTSMTRHVDYSIDYGEGTLFFKEPVDNKDFDMNPVYIVVDYESFDSSDTSYNYGGRAAGKAFGGRAVTGITRVHEESVGRQGDLTGADATVKLTEKVKVTAEAAKTKVKQGASEKEGESYALKISRQGKDFSGSAYARYLGEDFGLGHQSAGQVGTRKVGFDARLKPEGSWSYALNGYRNTYLKTGNERDLAEARATLKRKSYLFYMGLRRITDRKAGAETVVSDQLTTGAKWFLLDKRLVLRVDREQAIQVSDNRNADFPTRTTVGASFQATSKLTLMAAHEVTDGVNNRSEATRAGIKATPWTGGQVSSTLERKQTEEHTRVFSSNGLKQTWRASENWTLSAGFDKTTTIKDSSAGSASEERDFTAVSGGAKYKRGRLTWNSRAEAHTSNTRDKVGAVTAVSGEPRRGLGLSAGLHMFHENTLKVDSFDADLRLGLAYRPSKSRWTVLDRLDLIYEEVEGGEFSYSNWRVVNNHNTNYKVPNLGQVSVQYGAKYVKDTIDGKDYKGYTDLVGLEGRYNINTQWDVGAVYGMLHSYNAGQSDYRIGLSVGHSPVKNIWFSLGYNFHGFYDRDFSSAEYTMHGVFFRFRMKFDQHSAKDAVRWITGH
jgi:uncharacterized repeat protein (TIGR01451 family)